jgi:hypothetical protein
MNAARKLLLGLLAVVLVAGCANETSGPIERQTRDVAEFTAIDMEGSAELAITVGSPASVQIEAPAEVLDRLKTEVRGDTLYIESKPKDWIFKKGRSRPKVTVFVPSLASLRVGGGNEVNVHGFSGGDTQIRVEGAVDIEGAGELDRLTIRMAGAGNGDFSRLIATDTHVTVDGVGTVIVHPKETLNATMNGVGAIHYTGTPREVRTHMNGLGRIAKADTDDIEAADIEAAPDEQVEIDPDKLQPEYEDDTPRDISDVI